MSRTFRLLMSLFLCLLLPLQAGSAFARSAAMAATSLQLAHAIGAPHQHGAHAHHEHKHTKKAAPSVKDDGSHKSRHAKGECNNCAKCCVTAATAPPPTLPATFQPSATRSVIPPTTARIAAFIPDGPERPPRSLTA